MNSTRVSRDDILRLVEGKAQRMMPLLKRVDRILKVAAHLTSLALLTILTRRLYLNLRFLQWSRAQGSRSLVDFPRVSVLVPARNEAENIHRCITSLVRQDYPNVEIIVLNDGSTDATGERLKALTERYPQLTVIEGHEDLPEGWNGKCYACSRLANQANGEWLLFTDADTAHMPDSIRQGVAQALALDAAFLSVFPHQDTQSWSERLMVSFIMDFLPVLGLNLEGMWRGDSDTAANGQFMLTRATTYRALGGHAAVPGALVDDFALAKRFREYGHTTAFVDGTTMLECRMYRSASEVWNGFTRTLLLGLTTASREHRPVWWPLAFAWGYACLFVLPFFSLATEQKKRLALAEIGWLGLLRALANWHFKRTPVEIVTTPLAALGVMAVGLGAITQRLRSQEVAWKGRTYSS
jgi:chlorobactene glucosyltransferase